MRALVRGPEMKSLMMAELCALLGSRQRFAPRRLPRKEQLERRAAELLAAARPGALGPPGSVPPIGDVFVGGHSYGGPAALLAGASAPAAKPRVNVSGLLLHDPARRLCPRTLGQQELRPGRGSRGFAPPSRQALGMGADVWAIRRGARGTPTLAYVSDEYDRFGVRCGDATLHTVGGFHGNFVDAPLRHRTWKTAAATIHNPLIENFGCIYEST